MLRQRTAEGWWLVTHPDHARLAGMLAAHWGNGLFVPPVPRASVLFGIGVHDDGWAARDASPVVTREGKPAAFSEELVGTYAAFEEIDLADYLTVRERAVAAVVPRDAYAALLVSMHTVNLLTERADRSTIRQEQLPLLDSFVAEQCALQARLRTAVRQDGQYGPAETTDAAFRNQFCLLQAVDALSLLSCVDFSRPATLLHALQLRNGGSAEVQVRRVGDRRFELSPYPFDEPELQFTVPAKYVGGDTFADAAQLRRVYGEARVEQLLVTVTAG